MAPICPKCGKEMKQVDDYWVCGNHHEPVFIRIESVSTPSAHPFSDLCAVLPTPIAFVLYEYFREVNPFIALWRMVDAVEIITRLFTIIVLSDIIRQKGKFSESLRNDLASKLKQPTLGDWKSLLKTALDNLPKEGNQILCFVSELPSFVHDKWLPELGSNKDKPEKKLIALRNLIAHAGRLPIEKAQELLDAHRQRFESLVKELSFLANYDLIACTKEGQIVWLKGLPDADGSFPNYDRPLSFVPEHERVYLVHEGEGLDLFPLHAFADILQWREERYEFEGLGEVAPQIYFRLSDRGYLECIPFSNRAVFSQLGGDAYQRFRDIFRLEEWRAQQKRGIQKFWDELFSELKGVFVGREEHISQVKETINKTSKGVLWISGKPGVGKSALMAKLVNDYIDKTQDYIVIPYFFRIGQAGCSTMDFLAFALERLHEVLEQKIELKNKLPELQQQFVIVLKEVLRKTREKKEKEKKVLFLVDGLDEIYRLEREFLNVLFMTMAVKERIVWVCAGRSEGDLEEALRSRGAVWVFPDGLPPLDEQAIRVMLNLHLGPGPLKYKLFERDEGERNRFVEAITRKSEGLPLYVRMVIEDLKAGRLTVWDEEKLPEGLKGYYEKLLERLQVSDIGAVLTSLFCILAWAKEPINEGTMNFLLQTHDLAGSDEWDELFQEVLEHGHLMLQQRPTPDGETGWTIYHNSFRQHLLQSRKVSRYRKWAQKRWLEVCKDWKALASQEPPLYRYVLRHYDEHLYDKWRMSNEQMTYDALCQLALDPDFKQAQIQHLPNEPNLPLKTVQLALDVAIKLEDAPMMARLLMEHAKRAQSEEETPLEAWRRGYRERALRMATEIIFERDHKLGTLWCLLLAWVAESEGEREWAKRFLDEVLKRWEGAKLTELKYWQGEMAVFLLGEVWQVEGAIEVAGLVLDDESKRKLAASWASKEVFDQALKVAEGIEEEWKRAEALGEIAVEMAKAGMFDQALKVAEGIEDEWRRAEALREIAKEMAKAGMEERAKEVFDQALKVAEGIEDEWRRAEALREIAKEMAKAGMEERAKEVFGQALKVAEEIEEAWWRAWALRDIAGGMAKAGMFGQALKVAEGIEGEWWRAWALIAIAEGMAEAGMFDQALKVAEGIEEADERAEALRDIAGGVAKAGMFDQALKVAEGIEEAGKRTGALRAIAGGMAKAGMFDQALRVAEGIEEAWWRAWALRDIAGGMVKAGMTDWAKEVFGQALKVAEGIEEAWWRAWALRDIAGGMVKAGMTDWAKEVFGQALKVAEGIEEAGKRAEALRDIAGGMAKAGMTDWAKEVFGQALKVAEGIEEAGKRTGALRAIAGGMAKAGMFDQALRVAEGIEDEWRRAEALREIAKEMAKAGMEERAKEVFDQALKVAEGIEEADERAEALRDIAGGMVKAGMTDWAKEVFGQALKVAEGIEEAGKRTGALRDIAGGMVKAGMFDQALRVAEGIEDEWRRAEALREIAKEMAKAGMEERAKEVFDQALKVAEGIEDEWRRAEALREIAKEMAKAGMEERAKEVFDQALKVAEGIEEAWWRAWALRDIAGGMVKAGMTDWAKEVFGQALKVAEGIEEAWWRAWALRDIAGGMAKAGMFGQALKVAEGIEGEWWRAWALIAIAEGMAEAGMFDQALKVVERIEGALWRAWAFIAIAGEMARAGEVERAVGIVEREMAVRMEGLPSVLEALVERAMGGDDKSKGGFLRLLPWCGWSLELAYKACGWLAWLYPEHGVRIAEEIIGENLSG
jgi:predicted nucleic acid-binding OB-fold protein